MILSQWHTWFSFFSAIYIYLNMPTTVLELSITFVSFFLLFFPTSSTLLQSISSGLLTIRHSLQNGQLPQEMIFFFCSGSKQTSGIHGHSLFNHLPQTSSQSSGTPSASPGILPLMLHLKRSVTDFVQQLISWDCVIQRNNIKARLTFISVWTV